MGGDIGEYFGYRRLLGSRGDIHKQRHVDGDRVVERFR
jgi:hypothetical protein